MKNSKIGHKKLLVTRSNKKGKTIYGRVQLLPKKQKLYKITNRQVNA